MGLNKLPQILRLTPSLPKALAEVRAIFRIALPVIAAQLLQMGMGVADTMMAGRVSALALSAVAMGSAMWFFAMIAGMGLMLALTPIISQHLGAGKHGLVNKELRQGMWLAVALSVVQMCTLGALALLMPWIGINADIVSETRNYLVWVAWSLPFTCLYMVPRFLSESMGHTMPMLWTQLLMLPVNVLGNYMLMFGNFGMPAMGASGAALSTGMAQTIGCLALYVYALRAPRFAPYQLRQLLGKPDWAHIVSMVRLGAPISIGIAMESGMFTATALLMGRFGVDVVAGHQIAINIASICFMVPLGVSMALTVRVGQAIGAGDTAGARYRGRLGIAVCAGVMLVSATAIALSREWLAGVYTPNAAVVALAAQFMVYAAVFQLVDGIQVGAMGVLRGYKDTKVPMIITVFCYWVVGMGFSITFGVFGPLGPAGLWAGLVLGLATAAAVLTTRFGRLTNSVLLH